MFDSHIHSENSPDSKQTLDEICLAAIEKGVKGVAITDHAHMSHAHKRFFGDFDVVKNIQNSINDACAAREKYKDKLKVFTGVEIGEYMHDPKTSEKVLKLTDYDIIIGSVHYVDAAKWELAYSKIKYDENVSDEEIFDYMELYFKEVSQMIDNVDFDVLAHLTCPARYINSRDKRNYDFSVHNNTIDEILKKIVNMDIALEINTYGIKAHGFKLCHEDYTIRKYYDMGGRKITLGSDAHRPVRIADGFAETMKFLKEIGFEHYCYYEKRKAKNIKLI